MKADPQDEVSRFAHYLEAWKSLLFHAMAMKPGERPEVRLF